jgi:hypothetical protein
MQKKNLKKQQKISSSLIFSVIFLGWQAIKYKTISYVLLTKKKD